MLKKNYFQIRAENATLLLRSQQMLILCLVFVVSVVERGIQFILHIFLHEMKNYILPFLVHRSRNVLSQGRGNVKKKFITAC